MGFAIRYRSTRPISKERATAIRKAAEELCKGRTWLSCEPVGFHEDQEDGRLSGFSKPNFQPHPDDVASAGRMALPDGTVRDMIDILCTISSVHGVDWELCHDYDPKLGFIREGECEGSLLGQIEAMGDLADMFKDSMDEFEGEAGGLSLLAEGDANTDQADKDDDDGEPNILPLFPKDC
jgi:hypothetical protein